MLPKMANSQSGFQLLTIESTRAVPLGDGLNWLPIRRLLGIEAFGVNAFHAAREGDVVIEEHLESPGQEELYVVLDGAMRMTIDDDEVDAGAGTAIFIADPERRRAGVALADGTVVLAVGGWPGQPYRPLPWEPIYLARPAMQRGDWGEAAATLLREGGEHSGTGILQYRLACCHARLDEGDRAIAELERAIAIDPGYRERAVTEEAFAALRDRGDWPA